MFLDHLWKANKKTVRDLQALKRGLQITRERSTHSRRVDQKIMKLWDDLDVSLITLDHFIIQASMFFEPDPVLLLTFF